jgi:hypothetical protein
VIAADEIRMPRRHSLAGVPSILFIASMATFVQSFVAIKLSFLAIFLFAALLNVAFQRTVRVYPRLIYFYLVITITGILWAFVGMTSPGTYSMGITDALRLYTLWSAAFLLLYTLLRSQSSLQHMHWALVLAGILISLMNFAGVIDQIGQFGLIPESVSEPLHQGVGINEGYIQITSRNIGSLFFLVPYLIALQVRADSVEAKSFSTKCCLALCLILTVISGRRALLLVVALTPFMIIVVSLLSGNLKLIKIGARRLFVAYTLILAAGAGTLVIQPKVLTDLLYVQHIEDAFSTADERSLQMPFLVEGFKTSPIIGSGFGASAGYQRNVERPWIYELTYYQMLFNSGVLGVAILIVLLSIYSIFIASIFRKFKANSAIPFGLLIGIVSLLIGANSNPYLGSFDLLFFVGVFPFLSTFRHGFEDGR